MLLKMYKLESEEEPVIAFSVGSHTIGRGDALQCNDKRVSRAHAVLEITEDTATLTSLHINPVFFKVANSNTVTILSKNATYKLGDGDKFGFLPDLFWFKIKLCPDEFPQDANGAKIEPKVEASPNKRSLPDDSNDEETPAKRTRHEEEAEDDFNNTKEELVDPSEVPEKEVNPAAETNEGNTIVNDNAGVKEEPDAVLEPEPETIASENRAEPNDQNDAQAEVKEEPVDGDKQSEANSAAVEEEGGPSSSSGPKERRERCWYGATCYRKNPLHHKDFTHPGDSDFESDPDDDRPPCPFGATCYRRNRNHRRQYKHPPGKPPSKDKRKARKAAAKKPKDDNDEYSDLSEDEEDPFINDDESDDYVVDSDDSDTDWEDSQNAQEDSQEVKRMLREAKKFMKK